MTKASHFCLCHAVSVTFLLIWSDTQWGVNYNISRRSCGDCEITVLCVIPNELEHFFPKLTGTCLLYKVYSQQVRIQGGICGPEPPSSKHLPHYPEVIYVSGCYHDNWNIAKMSPSVKGSNAVSAEQHVQWTSKELTVCNDLWSKTQCAHAFWCQSSVNTVHNLRQTVSTMERCDPKTLVNMNLIIQNTSSFINALRVTDAKPVVGAMV
jgi:hypothetical protein